ncbi:MAG TPA: hypothetical protein DCX53_06295 [Anaerolineae bacterium]|nr:hypothetical protein [Anaerolineae bacterium]
MKDLEVSITFYQKLDFKIVEDHRSENWAVLQHNNFALALYQGHLENNLMNFRGGDVEEIFKESEKRGLQFLKPAASQSDGSWSAEILDPDGNVIFLNTYPEERKQYLETGKLIDYK